MTKKRRKSPFTLWQWVKWYTYKWGLALPSQQCRPLGQPHLWQWNGRYRQVLCTECGKACSWFETERLALGGTIIHGDPAAARCNEQRDNKVRRGNDPGIFPTRRAGL